MEKQITLTILAEDIHNNSYVHSDTCPITRALHRAGYPDYKDSGLSIIDKNGKDIVTTNNPTYEQLATKVLVMYGTKYGNSIVIGLNGIEYPAAPIEDFTHVLTFNIEDDGITNN